MAMARFASYHRTFKAALEWIRHASVVAVCLCVVNTGELQAQQDISTPAERVLLLDVQSGDTLVEKNADVAFPPASMSKLMTVYLAFDEIKRGNIRLDDEVFVSDDAWRNWNTDTGLLGKGGSTMFLRAGDTVTVEDLLKGIIVLSGNDACVVLAEHMAGSHAAFVEWMNVKAQEIGLEGSHFENANGWPADGHVMPARDLAMLSLHLIKDFPDLYPLFGEQEFLYKNFRSNRFNRNPLLGRFPGADGLKTGHTEDSGYGLVASAIRGDRRLILVAGGMTSNGERTRESQRLMQFGFRNFKYYPLFTAGETIDYGEIWLGQKATVPMVLDEDLALTLSRRQRLEMKVTLQYENPIAAPVKKGDSIGKLRISVPEREDLILDVKAGDDIEEVAGFGRIGAALEYLVFGASGAKGFELQSQN